MVNFLGFRYLFESLRFKDIFLQPDANMTLNIKYDRGHLPALDGLRGIAVLVVMGFHIFPNHVKFGWMGVDLFFVLSGFLITGILLDSKGTVNYYRNYLAKRTLRIFPLYYFFLIVFFIVFPLTGYSEFIHNYEYLSATQSWYWLYIQNWRIFFDAYYPGEDIISHFWSLAIEEQFYIFWPLIIYLLPKDRIVNVCLMIIAISVIIRLYLFFGTDLDYIKVYVFTFSRLDALAVGGTVAGMIRNERMIGYLKQYTFWVLLISAGVVMATIGLHQSFDFKNFSTYGYTVLALFFGTLLLLALSDNRYNVMKTMTETKLLAFFGKYSYGLYVYHIPVLRICMYELKGVVSRSVMLVIAFMLSIVIAYLSYHLIEKHFLKLKSRFQAKV